MTDTLGGALLREMARMRDEVIPAYQSIGIAGMPVLSLIRQDLDKAARAMAEGDLAGMIAALKDLREYEA